MLLPTEQLRAIYELLFRDGVMVARRDHRPQSRHAEVRFATQLQIFRAMRSLRSRGFVRETAAWQHHYWYLTDEGIGFLRGYLRLPTEIVPASMQRFRQPTPSVRRLQGRGPGVARGASPDRQAYRRAVAKDEDKVASVGAAGLPVFEFRGGKGSAQPQKPL
uniref:Plectin/eS10 N-terminal domain-containing protein n=1 Tax=Petromyzon marinus TaxID=7757 RepID=S4RDP9_PETMA